MFLPLLSTIASTVSLPHIPSVLHCLQLLIKPYSPGPRCPSHSIYNVPLLNLVYIFLACMISSSFGFPQYISLVASYSLFVCLSMPSKPIHQPTNLVYPNILILQHIIFIIIFIFCSWSSLFFFRHSYIFFSIRLSSL